jgi:uncharacterized tellurite resistance protein B-like protein
MADFWKKMFPQDPIIQHDQDTASRDIRVAAAVLLLEMAHIDDTFEDEEREAIRAVLKDQYGLSDAAAAEIIRTAEKERRASLDMWQFTDEINEHFSKDEKIRIVELLWTIVFADDRLDGHEDHLVHVLSRMLHLSHKELIDAKLSVLYDEDSET